MRQPERRTQREHFDAVFQDPQRAALATTYMLTIGDEPFEARNLRSFSEKENPARAIEGELTRPLGPRHEGRRLAVEVYVEGVRFRDYYGWCLEFENDSNGGYTFGGATSGYWQSGDDAVRFQEQTSYAAWPPSRVAYDLMRRLPYERIQIPHLERPQYNRFGEDAFSGLDAIGEALGDIEEKTSLRFRDNGADWGMGYIKPSLANPSNPIAHWHNGRHLSSVSARRRNAARYRDVAVVRQLSGGEYQDMVLPRPEVRYKPGVQPPPPGTTYFELVPDETADDPGSDWFHGAHARAFVLVQTLGNGEYDMEVTTTFLDPRVEDFDVVEVTDEDLDTGVSYTYRMLIEAHDHNYEANTGTYVGTGALIEEREPVIGRDVPSSRSVGVVRTFNEPETILFPAGVLYPGDWVFPGGGIVPAGGGEPLEPSEAQFAGANVYPGEEEWPNA